MQVCKGELRSQSHAADDDINPQSLAHTDHPPGSTQVYTVGSVYCVRSEFFFY